MTIDATTASATASAPFVSARIQPDSRAVVLTTTWLVGLLAAVSFALGVPGLVDVASWAGLPPQLRWGVPLMIDGGLIVMALVAIVRRARQESAMFAWSVLAILTVASMALQVAHVASLPGERWALMVGMGLAASFPAVVFAATHSLLDIAVAPAPSKRRKAKTASVPVQQASQRARTAASTAPRKSTVKAKATAAEKTEMVGEVVQGAGEAPEKATTPKVSTVDTNDREALRSRVLELRSEGKSYGKIAGETGVPVSTVKRWAPEPV
ncbi:helix-turn-helix domain-containing protein [Jonesia quinghaiensis]|uniref:helix-turn-helix domain-containing protein n=1 Tax=Jonesia quinghaiensis TaxID=262806 RepID=UPI000405AAD2|nr:helix-turn-helix domain-containing protein [Jonesia quinghaiensis]